MELVDFNGYEQNQRMYGGTAGRKMGICYNGSDYILKFPGSLKEKQMKNISLSYSNSPVCEYVGSRIYGMPGFDVHDTVLGVRNGKTVVACRDFLGEGERLYEFDKIKVVCCICLYRSCSNIGKFAADHQGDVRAEFS